MRLDRALGVGARGGHGPVRYHVEAYRPGESVRFRFERPKGLDGYHEYSVIPMAADLTLLRHLLVAHVTGAARLTWPLILRPLHDALIEDSLDAAARALGLPADAAPSWSPWVRVLRACLRRSRAAAGPGAPPDVRHGGPRQS